MNKSFQLIRTNPRLTTNYKIVISSDNLYLESFNSSKELSDDKYKNYLLPNDAILEDILPKFYDTIPKNIAFSPKLNNDANIMHDSYNNQFDDIYYSGSKYIEDQTYIEEFEYFAPLYIVKNNLPSNFIIMRVDDPVIYEKVGNEYILGKLSKDNFKTEIIDKWKCIKNFDLSNNSKISEFLNRNINDNDRFPDYSFFFDTKKYNYSKWYGMDYNSGVYTEKEMFLDDYTYKQRLHYEMEEFITKGFENNDVIYPYILNLNFLFDDEPATPEEENKYSMNRYFGFYTDQLEHVETLTTYNLKEIKSNLYIKNNIFLKDDGLGGYEPTNPFVNESIVNDWVLYNKQLYEIRYIKDNVYKLVSDIIISPNTVSSITIDNNISYINDNIITMNNDISIDEYIDDNITKNFYADLYLIEIDDNYHVLKNNPDFDISGNTIYNNYYIQTDYNISSNINNLKYYKGGIENIITKSIKTDNDRPLVYNIYRVNFSDIKDFDYERINTKYADFDYEQSEYVDTIEEKLYADEYKDSTVPRRKKTIPENFDGQYKLMNISSEYIADDELFEVKDNNINSLWDKNQTINKWGYRGSISHSDYPYKINNNYKHGGVYNRTTNTGNNSANVKEKNIDYLYRIGELYKGGSEHIINYMNFSGTSFIVNNWNNSNGLWKLNKDFSGTDLNTGDIIFEDYTNTNGILEYNYFNIPEKYLEIGELYYLSFTITNTYADGDTVIKIGDGTFDEHFEVNAVLSYNYKATLRATNSTFSFVAKSAQVVISNLILIKVSDFYYYNQSINIQTKLFNNINPLPTDYRFNLGYYFDSNIDYFDFFFNNNMIYKEYGKEKIKPYLKYSVFNSGDSELPAVTSFKGIEYRLLTVDEMVLDNDLDKTNLNNKIRNIISSGGSEFNGYKFSSILSETYKYYRFDKVLTNVFEYNILPNGFYAWYSNNGLQLEIEDSITSTINDILPVFYNNWSVEYGDVGEILESQFDFVADETNKPKFILESIPLIDNTGTVKSVNATITNNDDDLIVGDPTYKYDVELKLKWYLKLNGLLSFNVYKLKIDCDSLKNGTAKLIDPTITYSQGNNGGVVQQTPTIIPPGTYGTFIYNGEMIYSIQNLTFEEATSDFIIKYNVEHTNKDITQDWFDNHVETNITIDKLTIDRSNTLTGPSIPIDASNKVNIERTDDNTVKTNIIDSHFNLKSLKTLYSQQFSKLINSTTYKYDIDFIFKWKAQFNESNSNFSYIGTMDSNSFDIPINENIFKVYGDGNIDGSKQSSNIINGVINSNGTKTISLKNVNFIGTNNEISFNTYIGKYRENTGVNISFTDNIETYVELVEVVVNREYPTYEYSNPTLLSTKNESITIDSGDTKYSDIFDSINNKNGLHVIVNKKYKNVLTINNKIIPINIEFRTMNNVDFFDNNHGLYYGKTINNENNFIPDNDGSIEEYNANNLTASNYIKAINNYNEQGIFDDYITYYIVDEDGTFAKTRLVLFNINKNNYNMENVWDNIYPPFILSVNEPNSLSVNKKQYNIYPDYDSLDLLKDKYIIYRNDRPLAQSIIDDPLARIIDKNVVAYNKTTNYHGEVTHNLDSIGGNNMMNNYNIKRFVGYYEPIFNNIPLYNSNYIWKDNEIFKSFIGNYIFNTDLNEFGFINEIMYSKVNEDENVLKLKDDDNYNSIYPMVDEIGLSQTNRFIFLSPWDNNFFIKTTSDIDLLELFKDPKEIEINRPLSAEIIFFDVETPSYFYNTDGNLLYANDNSTNQIQYKFKINNTSSDDYEFFYNFKYISDYGINEVISGTSAGIVNQGTESSTIYFNADRPEKIQSGESYYEEYTKWTAVLEIYIKLTDIIILNSNNNIEMFIYNELVNFNINSYTTPLTQEVNGQYSHSIQIQDTVNKLSNFNVNLNLKTKSNKIIYNNIRSISGTENFNLNLYTIIGGLEENEDEYRNNTLEARYYYWADNSNQLIYKSRSRNNIDVNRDIYVGIWFGNDMIFDIYDLATTTARVGFKIKSISRNIDIEVGISLYDGTNNNLIGSNNHNLYSFPPNIQDSYIYLDIPNLNVDSNKYYYAKVEFHDQNSSITEITYTHWVTGIPKTWVAP